MRPMINSFAAGDETRIPGLAAKALRVCPPKVTILAPNVRLLSGFVPIAGRATLPPLHPDLTDRSPADTR